MLNDDMEESYEIDKNQLNALEDVAEDLYQVVDYLMALDWDNPVFRGRNEISQAVYKISKSKNAVIAILKAISPTIWKDEDDEDEDS